MACGNFFCGYNGDGSFFMQKYIDMDENAGGYFCGILRLYCGYFCGDTGYLSLQYAFRHYPGHGKQQDSSVFSDAVLSA
jgi:hypothetical protein